MKIKVLGFILVLIFTITGVAFAMPNIEAISTLSEPAMMFIFGMFLTGVSFYGRKVYAEQRIDRNR